MTLYDDLLAAGLPVELLPDGSFTFTRSIDDRESEIYYNTSDPQRPIRLAEEAADRQQIKDLYLAIITRLEQIENAANPTNAQVIAAVRDIAKYERWIFKVLRRLI